MVEVGEWVDVQSFAEPTGVCQAKSTAQQEFVDWLRGSRAPCGGVCVRQVQMVAPPQPQRWQCQACGNTTNRCPGAES